MKETSAKVLKKHEVITGQDIRLGSGGTAPVSTAISHQTDSCGAPAAQQARIIESNSEYAVIQITCSCGRKSFVQCNYAQFTEK